MLPGGRGEVGVGAAPVVRGVQPASFAVVMATGIVSTALRGADLTRFSAVLLAIAVACFAILAAASALRAAAWTLTFTAMIVSLAARAARWPARAAH